tara:strand:- start:676 stop:1194 length:519 start_codon:yes stop_codon:yes gene_type:complete
MSKRGETWGFLSEESKIDENIIDFIKKSNAVIHSNGMSVVAPNGAGKSTYARKRKDWVDGDELLKAAISMGKKTEMSENDMKRADRVTKRAKERGLWILTATWYDPKLVDIFVVPREEALRERLEKKDFPRGFYENNIAPYVKKIIRPLAEKHNIPIVEDFNALDLLLKNNI